MAAYQPEDADLYHGRGALVAELLDLFSPSGPVVVVGPSGSGKSSLLRAGLVPAYCGGIRPYAVCMPGAEPVARLAAAPADVSLLVPDARNPHQGRRPVAEGISRRLDRLRLRRQPPKPVLIKHLG
ncbi:hypothetical protein ABT297_22610 [Dactylosporangium sp. NPDC000555]|uniref:nSTAND1 domain-containing NTPase n=1 Tax=Dactylosporangium sp. NPDC000555 TaxID=3154260 RepID=UPI0033297740